MGCGGDERAVLMSRERAATVLLVDDDHVDALAVSRAFRQRNLPDALVRARDGLEALEILRGAAGQPPLPRPHVVILDLNMPRMNGLEFLAELRADPALRDTIVFVLTTSSSDQDLAAAYRHNIAGYLAKSTAGEDVSKVVKLLEDYWRVVEPPRK
jgi:CheY-like chemotaxis protein